MELVTVDDVRTVAKRIDGLVVRTPLLECEQLSTELGCRVLIKAESLQHTGSFKPRGVLNTMLSWQERGELPEGVVGFSAGNHAAALAYAGNRLGVRAVVSMPTDANPSKVDNVRRYGGQIVPSDDLMGTCAELGERYGWLALYPFDMPEVIAGQGTVGLEILEQVPDVATVLVSTGGGGLVGGIASVLKERKPDTRVVGVQAAGAAAVLASLEAGEPVRLDSVSTMADGIAVGAPGPVSYAHIAALVDDVVTVNEESLSRAVLLCLERRKLVVEPAGAATVAALLEHRGFEPPVVAVLSGGNADPLLLLNIIRHGMTAAGRYLSLRVRVRDRPGSLGALLTRVGELGANVLDVAHSRIAGALDIGDVEIELNLETRGPEHCVEVAAALQRAGYTVVS